MKELVHKFLDAIYKDNPITKVQYSVFGGKRNVTIYQDGNIELVTEVHDYGNNDVISNAGITLSLKINAYFVLDDREIDLYIREWCENNYSIIRFV